MLPEGSRTAPIRASKLQISTANADLGSREGDKSQVHQISSHGFCSVSMSKFLLETFAINMSESSAPGKMMTKRGAVLAIWSTSFRPHRAGQYLPDIKKQRLDVGKERCYSVSVRYPRSSHNVRHKP